MRLAPDEAQLFLNLYLDVIGWCARHLDPKSRIHDAVSARAAQLQHIAAARDRMFDHPSSLEAYVARNPHRLSPGDLALVSAWRHFVRGDLVAERDLKRHTVFLDWKEPPTAYGALSLTEEITELLGRPLPVLVEAVLLPWRGAIVCDGILRNHGVELGPGIRRGIADAYRAAKQRGIITTLEDRSSPTSPAELPKTARGRKTKRRAGREGVEWVGGLVSMPGYVTGEGEPYRPEMIFWMDERGAVLGTTIGKPGKVLGLAAASLRSAIERPLIGDPHAPARVRVASTDLAHLLRKEHPTVDVVCAPTPEIDGLVAMLEDRMGQDADHEQSYLGPDRDPAAVASFFRAAAGLFRAAPWKTVPSDHDPFSITIESLGLRDAALSVIGQMEESLGFVLFSGLDAFDAFVDAADAMEHGENAAMPPHLSLNFERGADLGTSLRKEIAAHGWVVAAADAYPWLVATDEDLVARPATPRELEIGEAIALALCEVLGDRMALVRALAGGNPFGRTISVRTHSGDVDVSIRAPHPGIANAYRPPFDVVTDLFELAKDGAEIDQETRNQLEEELVDEFAASPEAQALTVDVGMCRLVMSLAAGHFGATIATLRAMELREIVFETIPRKVSIRANEAHGIIEEMRALYAFMKRQYGLAQADACLRVLGRDAVAELEAALSDARNFGMAKSLVAAGREGGAKKKTKQAGRARKKKR